MTEPSHRIKLLVRTPIGVGILLILLVGLDEFILGAFGLPYLLGMSVGFGLLIPLLVLAGVARLSWIWTCFLILAMLALILPGLPLGRAATRGYRLFYRNRPATQEALAWARGLDWANLEPGGKTYLQGQRDAPGCMDSLHAHSARLQPRTQTVHFKIGGGFGGEAVLIVGRDAAEAADSPDLIGLRIEDHVYVACVVPRW